MKVSISATCCALVLCILVGEVKTLLTPTSLCPRKFSDYNINHTACLAPREGDEKPITEGVSEESKVYIVNLHNHYRSKVEDYNNQPAATNMQKMYWDNELAMIAQKWASHCIWEHDESANRAVPGRYAVGQNLGRGHQGWGTVISHWQSEVNYLTFGQGKDPSKPIGHYTQMVWAESARIGCGYARCNRTQSYYVCNYGPTGNMHNRKFSPYEAGSKAAGCPSTSASGLCDCNGKVCLNGGKLDLNTCQCDCPSKPWIKQSGDCSLDCSKAEDSFACATKGGNWGLKECGLYVNIPHEYCPIMCRLCPDPSVSGISPTSTTSGADLSEKEGSKSETTETPLQLPSNFPFGSSNDTWWDSVLNGNGGHRNTAPAPVSSSNKPTTTEKTTPTESKAADGLPVCTTPVEEAKCGQPSAKGYYDPKYCNVGLDHYCPGLCGKCKVTSCIDYENNSYGIGEHWMTEYGKLTCTAGGVSVERGCPIEKAGVVISEYEEYTYLDANIRWQCLCSEGYSLSCKGVWTPASRRRL